jgi:hypothetical protein
MVFPLKPGNGAEYQHKPKATVKGYSPENKLDSMLSMVSPLVMMIRQFHPGQLHSLDPVFSLATRIVRAKVDRLTTIVTSHIVCSDSLVNHT